MKAVKFIIPIIALFLAACSSSSKTPQTPADLQVAPVAVEQETEPQPELEPIPEPQPYAIHTEWPAPLDNGLIPITANVTQGVEEKQPYGDEGDTADLVWAESKGYINAGMKEIYAALMDGDVIAPLHMSNKYTISDLTETPELTSFKLATSFRFVVMIDLEFTWNIQPVRANDEVVGYDIVVEKTGGSKYLYRMVHHITFRKMSSQMSKFEMRSDVQAAMNKEEETVTYVRDLYQRILAHVQPAPAGTTTEPASPETEVQQDTAPEQPNSADENATQESAQ